MNPFTKNAVIAGLVALVVALGVVFGARAISPTDNNSGVTLKVTAPDGSVIGTTEPVRASSGPPVPACSVNGTFLECQGAGVPFTWGAVGFSDGGLNEAFGQIVPGTYTVTGADGGTGFEGLVPIALATITPALTGDLAATATFGCPGLNDSSCITSTDIDAKAPQMIVLYSVHGDASAAVPFGFFPAATGSPVAVFGGGAAVAKLEAGQSYDVYYAILYGVSSTSTTTFTVTDASVGGIWVHEFP